MHQTKKETQADRKKRLEEIRKRLQEYEKHKNDPYVYFDTEIAAVSALKHYAAEDIKFLLEEIDRRKPSTL